MDKIRVLVVDDHPLFREGVAQILTGDPGIEVVAKGATADEAVRLASTYLPDVLLLDIQE
jgi:two-component system, NarL family, nitrate/nitrite response regulator NarL